jgi:hypothetical protein
MELDTYRPPGWLPAPQPAETTAPAPAEGRTFAPLVLCDPGRCGLCDALREGAG